MTTRCPYMAPLTEANIRRAIEAERVMNSKQAAAWLRVNPITVRTLKARGRLRTILPGIKPLLFLEDDVHHCEDVRAGTSDCNCGKEMTRL